MQRSRLLLLAAAMLAAHVTHAEGPAAVSAEEALDRLQEGNRRFTSGRAVSPHQTVERREKLAGGQAPMAVVLTCADSRVSPEIYFDQGLGDLFVIRNAGNVVNDHVLGSIEYAIEHLHVPLIVVVGHEKCGAVGAAVAGGQAPGHIAHLVEAIAPAVASVKTHPGDKLDNSVRENARRSAGLLAGAEPFLKAAAASGKVRIVAAHYDLVNGKVEILP